MSEQMVVEWIGGPFDEQRFTVEEGTKTITVQREDGSRFDLPVLRRKSGCYVVFIDPDEPSR
jgi:hypothetical protein